MEGPDPTTDHRDLKVSIRLISPAQDLSDFPDLTDLPVSTTVGQIKLLIGNELALRSRSPAGMRVIYRGRLLSMDENTLAQVFGIATIQETSLQVLHLVLRDGAAGANAGVLPAAATNPLLHNPFAPRTNPEQPPAPVAGPGFPSDAHLAALLEQNARQRMQNLDPIRGPLTPEQYNMLRGEQQRQREIRQARGGVPLNGDLQTQVSLAMQQARQREQNPTEAVPNLSQRHHIAQGFSPGGLQTPSATTTGASTGPAQYPARPNVYVLESPSGPRAVLVSNSAPYQERLGPQYFNNLRQQNRTYFVQMAQQLHLQSQQLRVPSFEAMMQQNMQNMEILQRLRELTQHRNEGYDQHASAQQQGAAQNQGDPPAAPAAGEPQQMPNLNAGHHGAGLRPNNPGAGFLAAMWPHVWLVTRLVLFVWWFTNPSASWSRWVMVILVAFAVFVYNTGVLDGLAEQAWTPIRAHIDGLVNPGHANGGQGQDGAQNAQNAQNAAGGDANAAAANGANGDPTAPAPIGRAGGPEPDPAEAAARLVAQRRRNNGERLRDFAQRLERIGIMFLASLAPGIAERHVALAEERERDERRRAQEAADAANAAAAEAQAQAEAAAAAAAAAAAGGDVAKAAEAGEDVAAPEDQISPEDEAAAVDAQWQAEQQRQNEREAAGVL